jgi:hypothetical protein
MAEFSSYDNFEMVPILQMMKVIWQHNNIFKRKKISHKPECVGRFNMDWQILVFYPEPEVRDNIY